MSDADRTIVVGFDGLDFRYLDQYDLPTFDALRADGVEAPLSSTFPPWTGSAWPSTYTGSTPDHHGAFSFFDFADRTPTDAPLLSRNEVRLPAIWDYLGDREARSIVLNVPVTHPADEIEGVLVPGYLAPEHEAGHPDGIRAEISDAIGREYRIYTEIETDGADADKLDSYVDLVRSRGEAAGYLLDAYDWEFAFIQVQKTDAVFHDFEEDEAFKRVYRAADEVLDTVRSAAPDANVIVCSDHGIGPIDGSQVAVNEVLRRAGFLESAPDGDLPSLGDKKTSFDEEDGAEQKGERKAPTSTSARAAAAAESMLRAVGLTPDDAYAVTKQLGVDKTVRRLLPDEVLDSAKQGVDWPSSQAYCRIASELGVRISVEGRDPDGIVPPDRYDETREAIIDVLSDVKAGDGEPVFEWVKPREDVYDGPATDDACDVLFYPREMNHLVTARVGGRPVISADTFNHQQHGVFIAAGPAFANASPGSLASPISLTSVAPTAIASLGLPVPDRMTGDVPAELALPSTRERYDDVRFATGAADEDEGDVRDRLSDLGYL